MTPSLVWPYTKTLVPLIILRAENVRIENANSLLAQAGRGEGRWGSLEREIQYIMPQYLEYRFKQIVVCEISMYPRHRSGVQ